MGGQIETATVIGPTALESAIFNEAILALSWPSCLIG
jgi:hypothetical protein